MRPQKHSKNAHVHRKMASLTARNGYSMTSFLTSGIGQRWKTAFVFPMLRIAEIEAENTDDTSRNNPSHRAGGIHDCTNDWWVALGGDLRVKREQAENNE